MNTKERIILAGGTGFLGRVLAPHRTCSGYDVVMLSRARGVETAGVRAVAWDGETLGRWVDELGGAIAVVAMTR